MSSLEARLALVKLAMADDHNWIGKLAKVIDKCSSEYEEFRGGDARWPQSSRQTFKGKK